MKFFVGLIFVFLTCFGHASHIVGGDIYYDHLGGNSYRINLTLYRDCASSGAQFDDPLYLTIFYGNSNLTYQTIMLAFPGSQNVPVVFNNPCATAPSGICIEKATYTTVVSLPPVQGGYTVSYQRCCRGPNVTNLQIPEDTGLTLTTHIPGSETGFTVNSSPRFTNYPPIVICNNDDLIFNHSATDPDGDQLVYSLVTPYHGGSSSDPQPNPIPAPPYSNVIWQPGYSANNPLGPGATIQIDPVTGVLTASPNLQGLFVVGICVQEYRNGVLIGRTVRDFLFRVINCNITMQAIVPEQEDMEYFESYCQGLTVIFDNNSYGATNYAWDFGVPNTTTDVSSAFEPTFTYPQPGTYIVTLVANPGWSCTDTVVRTIIVNELLEVSYTSDDSLCIQGNSFDFDGSVIGSPNASFLWDFGPNASIQNATTLDVNNVIFSTPGFTTITLHGSIGTCQTSYTDSIYIFSMPTVAFQPPPNYLCEGLTVTLDNQTQNATYYSWNFGLTETATDVSTDFEPTFSYPQPGTYIVKLVAGSQGTCVDSVSHTLIMNEILQVSFTSDDSLCITGNSFDFQGSYVGSTTTTFNWNFGPSASVQNATTLNVNDVHFSHSGAIPVTLTGNYANCTHSFTDEIYIFPEPTIDFTLAPGLQCVPFEAHFIDLCTAASPLHYFWDLGNGSTSIEANPIEIYDSVGTYDITLTIYAEEGCTDTLTKTIFDLVQVHPTPVSHFIASTYETDICHATVQFTDLSEGGETYFYMFNAIEGTTVQHPAYTFHEDGLFHPIQYVTNEFLCVDSSTVEIYISPYTVYIPNTFTPDGDEFNNDFMPVTVLPAVSWDFKIYDRWGEVVFSSTDQYDYWDGTYKGRLVPDGLYNYILQYQSCEDVSNMHVITGYVNVLR